MCGVVRVDFQHPNRGDGSSSGNRPLEGTGKTLRQVFFQVELEKVHICTTAVSRAASDTRQEAGQQKTYWSPADDCFRNDYARAARIRSKHQVEALAEAIVMVQTTPLRVPCVWSYQS